MGSGRVDMRLGAVPSFGIFDTHVSPPSPVHYLHPLSIPSVFSVFLRGAGLIESLCYNAYYYAGSE